MALDKLFEPFTLGPITLKNRVVMAPMTRSKSPQHIPTQAVAEYYAKRAAGGVGLIITEGTVVNHPAGHAYPDVPNIHGDAALHGWQNVIAKVHDQGSLIFPQLWHVGSVRQTQKQENQGADNPQHCCVCNHPETKGIGPSAIAHPYCEQGELPRAMTKDDIEDVINAFTQAAIDAKAIGFDGVELHGAHGYLIDQFFWQATNQRQDEYGGKTLAQRTRFACELIASVRKAVGPDYPVSLRISQWKMGDYNHKMAASAQELEQFLEPLVDAGVSLFHCSTRRFYEPEFDGSPLNFAAWVKKLSGLPTITVGSVGLDLDFISAKLGNDAQFCDKQLADLNHSLNAGEFDLVAVGRMLIANPDWPQIIATDNYASINPFKRGMLESLR